MITVRDRVKVMVMVMIRKRIFALHGCFAWLKTIILCP